MGTTRELAAYKKSYAQAMLIFEISEGFPSHEKYELINQMRRSSRSIVANLVEGHKMRAYKKVFRLKLHSCYSENEETRVWIDFAKDCQYLDNEECNKLVKINNEVGSLLYYMLKNFNKFCD